MAVFVMVTVQRCKSEWWEVVLVGLVGLMSCHGRFRRQCMETFVPFQMEKVHDVASAGNAASPHTDAHLQTMNLK